MNCAAEIDPALWGFAANLFYLQAFAASQPLRLCDKLDEIDARNSHHDNPIFYRLLMTLQRVPWQRFALSAREVAAGGVW